MAYFHFLVKYLNENWTLSDLVYCYYWFRVSTHQDVDDDDDNDDDDDDDVDDGDDE